MSILIKGMALPEDKEIFLRIDEKSEVYVYGSYPTELHKAVPVPPHGDLIERDKLIENCMQEDSFIAELLFRKVNNAPTILEAEESE